MRFWLLGFLFFLSPAFCATYNVLVYHGANPPYSFKEQQQVVGIFADIFKRLAELTGHEFKFVATSVARGQRFFDTKQVDIEPGVSPHWRAHQKVPGIYTQTYATSTEVLLANHGNTLENITQAYGSVVGKVRGYRYGSFEQHFDEDKLLIYENISEKELLGQLAYGRLDYVLIGKDTANYYMANNLPYRQFKFAYTVETAEVAMRLQPHLTTLQQELNQALQVMVERDEINEIYIKYTGQRN